MFASAFHLSFAAFAVRMLLPQLVALLVTYGLLRWCDFVGPAHGVPVHVVAFGGVAILAVCAATQAKIGLAWVRDVAWGAAGLAPGLFVLVRGVENLGLVAPLVSQIRSLAGRSPWWTVPGVALATAAASNGVNNLPAALLARTVLERAAAPRGLVLGALVGVDVGPNVTLVGSLATVLVSRSRARRASGSPAGICSASARSSRPSRSLPRRGRSSRC